MMECDQVIKVRSSSSKTPLVLMRRYLMQRLNQYRKTGRHFGLLNYMKQVMARDGDGVSFNVHRQQVVMLNDLSSSDHRFCLIASTY